MASGKFSWRIDNFSERQSQRRIYSDIFTLGGCNWYIMLYPKGLNVDCLSMYIKVANNESLPGGWSIDAKYSLTVVNQLPDHVSTRKEAHSKFTARANAAGWASFPSLTELHDSSKGYIVNDTLVVEAEIEVLNVSPPTVVLETFLSNMNKFITDTAQARKYSAGSSANGGMKSEVPSLEEVEMAKKSLGECLSDIFKLNVRDKLAKSLEILSQAEIGLSSEEKSAVQLFWSEFDDFVSDFLTFEHENSEFELHKLAKDQMFHSIKKMHQTHVSKKRRLDDLNKEEEEFKKKMEQARASKATLISEWETLMKESEAKKSEYTIQEKKLKEAEERKRIAEERMSRSTAAWSSLKLRFAKG